MRAISRREFLAAAASCCVAASGGEVLRRAPAGDLADALAAVVLDPVAAARLGRRFLSERTGVPQDADAIARMILPTRAERRAFAAADVGARKGILRRRIAADFADGRAVEVDGWVLAETETLLAALVALD